MTFTSSSSTSGLTILVPKSDCGTQRRFSFTRSGNICGGSLFIYVTEKSCGSEPGTTDLKLETLSNSSATSGTLIFSVADLLAARGAGSTCDTQAADISFNLCASARQTNSLLECQTAYTSVGTPAFVVDYDPEPPATPVIAKVIVRDSALSVQVDGAEDDSTIAVEAAMVAATSSDAGTGDAGTGDAGTQDAGTDDAGTADAGPDAGGQGLVGALAVEGTTGPVTRVTKAAGEGNVVLTGLVNGVTYRIQATVTDAAGNVSPGSATVDATPVKSNGLFDKYIEDGGEERGGCAATGGGIAGGAVLAALSLWLSSRRKVS
ncbi:hypothetical protein FOF48_05765 [Corallococcus sp. Z5C101001]|nr:MXAN_2561 family MXYO-CTERM-anchored protein [Corallococcus sp. Z5C101001]NBD08540.1 hypothetical protein [Corallococcus silvisoli]TSC33141.1 hypothetical protein FOF48_05765 [Corallococcus sp. Z5C101001]